MDRRGRAAAALAGVLLVAAGCRADAKAPQELPPGTGSARFLVQSFDAQGTLLLGTPEGVFRSVDAGASWRRTSPPIYRGIGAGFTKGSTIVTRGRIFQRGNLGLSRVNPPKRAPFGGGYVHSLAWLAGGKLYAYVSGARARIYVTLDSARSWHARPAIGLPSGVRQIAAARVPGRPDVLYAAAASRGLWRSLDGGISWGRLPGAGPAALAVATTIAKPQRVLSAGPRVRWSDDYGATWHATSFGARLLAGDPRNADIVFAVTEDGTLRASSDGGRTW